MKYGNTTDENGAPLIAPRVMAGPCVRENKLVSFDFGEDQNGQKVANRVAITFEQSNGYKLTTNYFDSEVDWVVRQLNRNLLHIAMATGTTAEDYERIMKEANCTNFASFIETMRDKIMKPAYGKMFNLKVVYNQNTSTKRWYPGLPKAPNFIESGDVQDTKLVDNPAYDVYAPQQEPMATPIDGPVDTSINDIF